jgi:hypothetical protein
MKKYWFVALLITSIACAIIPTPTPRPTPTERRDPTDEPANNPPPSPSKPDLILGVTYIEPNNDTFNTYKIVATIENLGDGEATPINAGCTYQCPAGDQYNSGGLNIVTGGYIGPNSSFTYKSPFHYVCTIFEPTIDLICTIESPDGEIDTYSVANLSLP